QWLAQPWDAVILQTFGSGNAPQHPTLLSALKGASARGVRIINRSQCARGDVRTTYDGAYALADCGVVAAGDQTLEMLLARFMTTGFLVCYFFLILCAGSVFWPDVAVLVVLFPVRLITIRALFTGVSQ